jgi:TP901 family phage tail tape measure protein
MAENVTTKFRVDISDLKKNIAEANRQVKQYRAELLNANAGMKKGEETADSLSRKIEAQSKIVEAEKAKLQALKDELAKYEDTVRKGEDIVADLSKKHEDAAKAFGEDSKEAKELAKQLKQAQEAQERNVKAADELRTKIINQDTAVKNAEAQVKQYSGALNDLQKEEKETGDAAEKTTNGGLNAFAVALGNLASQVITKAVQGLGNLVKSVIDTGKAFDSSMSKVKAISGATAEQMDKLSEKAEQMGATTKFTATEAADAMGYMAMAGWKTDDMLGGIDGVMNLAAASGAELATTSDIVTDSLTAFGEKAGEAGRLADIMAAAAANSNTNVEMMGETFKYAASLAGSLGYSMEDTAIATGLMANSGIKATQAGTSLRAMMTRMAAPTKDSATAMEALGLKLDDGHGNMKSLMQVMQELRASFGDLKMSQQELTLEQNKLNAALESGEMDEDDFNEAQEELIKRAYGAEGAMKAQYASMLAGKNGLSGFLAIVNASEEDFDKLTDSIYNSKDAAKSMAETMNDNLEGSLTLLSSAFDGFKKKLYDGISAPLNGLVKQITVNIMPALTGIIDGTPGAADKLADGISNLFSNALKSAAKILPRAVGALGAVLGALGDAIVRQAPEATDTAVKLLKQILGGVVNAIPGMVKGLGRIIKALANGLGEFVPHMAESIVDAIPDIMDALFDALPVILRSLLRLTEKIAEKLPELITSLVSYIPELVQLVADFLVEQTPVIVQSAISIVTGLIQSLPDIMQALVDALPVLIQTLTDFIANNAPMVLQACLDIATALVEAAPAIAKAIYPMIPQIMDMLVEGVMDFIPVWIDTAKTMFGMLADAVPDLWRGVKDASATAFEEWKTNIFDRARDAFGEIWDHIKDKVTPVGKKIGDAVGGAFKATINAVLGHVEERLNSIPNAINGAIDLLNALPGVSISPMDSITLPRLAKGGIVNKSTLAQIGEGGREAIIPLEKNKAGLREIARLLQGEMKGAAGSGAPGVSGKQNQGVVINMTQNNTSPKSLSAYDVWRQSKNMATLIKLQLQGV